MGAVRNAERAFAVAVVVILAQGFRNNHGGVGESGGGTLSGAQDGGCKRIPFLALPVEALDRHHSFLSGQTRYERKQGRSERVIVNDPVSRKEHVQAAEKCVHGGLQVFGADGGDADDSHSLMRFLRRREVGTAVDGDVVSTTSEFPADFFVVGFDAAIFRDDAAAANESHFQLAPCGLPDRVLVNL